MERFLDIEKLYGKPLPSTRTGMFYNAFAYPTKISPEAIAVYIAAHTSPEDTVLDVFGGSGSTGLAALMCERPTELMLKMAKELQISPVWGARNAVIYELGKYGSFASNIMCNPPDADQFKKISKEFLMEASKRISFLYESKDPEGNDGIIRHVVWSDIVICPKCQREISYYDLAVEHNPMQIKKEVVCPYCNENRKTNTFVHKTFNIFDKLLNKEVVQKKRIPILIYGQTGKKKWVRKANEEDIHLFEQIENMNYPPSAKVKEIEWGDLYRAGYHTGITHLHHFYTKRNYYVMTVLWDLTLQYESKLGDALRLLLLSYNASHSTLMTRVVVKKDSKDFVLTGAQSGVLYISNLPVEKNILLGIERKTKNFIEAFKYVNLCVGKVTIKNISSENLQEAESSIDYLFTDPPFGDFIPYAEINQINELWLGETTDRIHEAIISNSQNKALDDYKGMLNRIFRQINRVIKKDAYATVVFHSSKAEVWNAVCEAFLEAGLTVKNTSYLNKTQSSFKQVVSAGSVQGDPVMLLAKGISQKSKSTATEILDETISEALVNGNKDVRLIYSNYLATCLKKGIQIEIGAKDVYEYAYKKVGSL